MHTGFWYGNLREISGLENLGLDAKIILKWIFSKEAVKWTGLV